MRLCTAHMLHHAPSLLDIGIMYSFNNEFHCTTLVWLRGLYCLYVELPIQTRWFILAKIIFVHLHIGIYWVLLLRDWSWDLRGVVKSAKKLRNNWQKSNLTTTSEPEGLMSDCQSQSQWSSGKSGLRDRAAVLMTSCSTCGRLLCLEGKSLW